MGARHLKGNQGVNLLLSEHLILTPENGSHNFHLTVCE